MSALRRVRLRALGWHRVALASVVLGLLLGVGYLVRDSPENYSAYMPKLLTPRLIASSAGEEAPAPPSPSPTPRGGGEGEQKGHEEKAAGKEEEDELDDVVSDYEAEERQDKKEGKAAAAAAAAADKKAKEEAADATDDYESAPVEGDDEGDAPEEKKADEGAEEKKEEEAEAPAPSPAPARADDGTPAPPPAPPAPPGTSIDPEKYRLTKEMALATAAPLPGGGAAVIVTSANFNHRDFVMNWVEHLRATGCENFLVGAMDNELLAFLVAAGVPTFAMAAKVTLGDAGWGSQAFNRLRTEAVRLTHTFTSMGIEIFVSDVDTVWLRNPLPYVALYPGADVLVSTDMLHPMVPDDDEGLEPPEAGFEMANIGVMHVRPPAAGMAAEWVAKLESDDKIWDQAYFNDLMHRGRKEPGLMERVVVNGTAAPGTATPANATQGFNATALNADRMFWGYDGRLKYGILPVKTFCSGHVYFVQRRPQTQGHKAYVMHATYQYSGTEGKRNRFREALLWNDPPEYFKSEGGFISVGNEVPQALKDAIKPWTGSPELKIDGVGPHFDLVNPQLTVLRALFGLATATRRAAVLPQLWCGFDRWWNPHNGNIPGGEFPLPYPCPSDHVLDLDIMSSTTMTTDQYGPQIPWRETSFLENPKAKALNASRVVVRTCGAGGAAPPAGVPCADGTGPAAVADGVVWLAANRTDDQLRAALGGPGVADAAVVHFESPTAVWGGFADPAAAARFKARVDLYGAIWCCVFAHPGHIWYDLFWDTGAHDDRHQRRIGGEWRPMVGP